ncbi:MAG: FAD-binding oxidoreductase [Pseudomonadota bacterium]
MNLLYANDVRGTDAPSWYAATAVARIDHPRLEGDHRADIAIVGGGYTGLSAALHLAQRGYSVALADAQRVGWGASGRNGGQVGSGQRLDPEEMDHLVGRDASDRLWHLAEEAKVLVRDLINHHEIDCDYRPGIIHAAHRARYIQAMKDEVTHLEERHGYETTFLPRDALQEIIASPAYHAGVIDPGGAHLHPLNYALGLAKAASNAGVRIFEQSEVTTVTETGITTAHGRIAADHIILACNGYLGNLMPEVAARVMPINNFIIATTPLDTDVATRVIANDMAVADTKFVVNYYRLSADRRLLFGGRESYGYRFPRDIKSFVRKAMIEIYPQLSDTPIDYGWGGTLAITMNRMPHFERLGKNVLSCSGYSGHGVAMATMAGALAAEAVAGQAERFDLLRTIPHARFPGGVALRWPLLVLAMVWYSMRDRL